MARPPSSSQQVDPVVPPTKRGKKSVSVPMAASSPSVKVTVSFILFYFNFWIHFEFDFSDYTEGESCCDCSEGQSCFEFKWMNKKANNTGELNKSNLNGGASVLLKNKRRNTLEKRLLECILLEHFFVKAHALFLIKISREMKWRLKRKLYIYYCLVILSNLKLRVSVRLDINHIWREFFHLTLAEF